MTTNITILKSEDPYHFWGREVPGPGMSEETIKFQGLIGEIQDYCSSDQYVMEYISDPVKGKMYLAQRLNDGVWYRVRVLNNLQTSNGIKSNCHMVDYGEPILVPISRLKDIPAKLKAFPVQAKPFRLHGVQPTTLSVDLEENVAELSPCEKWDQAAVEFFNKLIQGKSAQVDIHGIGRRETRFVTLYINTHLGQVNVNEELVSQKFAVRDERDFDEVSEIGSSEGAPSRPVTPRTYTPQITSPRKAEGGNLDSKGLAAGTQRDGAVGNASRVLPWRQTTKSPSSDKGRREGASVSPPNRRSPGVTVDRADEIRGHLGRGALQDVRPSSGDEKMGPSIHKVERMGADHSNEETSGLKQGAETQGEGSEAPQTVPLGRGRGLPAFGEQSEVGRTRSPSPASSSSPPATSNIRKSDNLQRMMAKSPSPAKSPQPSDVSDSSPQEASQSQKRRVQDRDGVSTFPEPSTKPSAPSLPLRLPFIKAPVVRPKEKTPLQGVLPPEVSRLQSKSPPSFISPVNDEKVARVPWRRQATPPSSDWNKRSSASGGNSETSDQDSTAQPGDNFRESSAERTKIIQRSLMRQLAPDDGTVPQPSSSASFDHRHGYDMGVVIHGEHIPEPIKRLPQAPFPDVLKRTFENVAPSGVSLIQACAWKAVLRGRDVVGIAPRDSGSSLAYILPLVTQLLQPDTYTSLPAGNGPLALIVCPSWLEATTIAEQCDLFVKAASKTLKTILIYGGGNEHQQEVQLVNGCHILVSTIPCVLRMIESNLTNLNRLCHLVFDNAHILFRDFNTEVKELMRVYSSSLLAQSTRSAPRQLLVFASEWRASLGSFLRVYMTNQMVVVTHKLEGAIYAKVRQSIEVVQDSQRTGVLLGKLQSGLAKGTKVIIFTNDRKKANDLTKILVSSSHYTLMATEDMMTDTLDKVKKEWSAHHRPDSIPLLVMTDGAIKDMGVTDAAYIIHFDFPPSKNAYGRRLGCMMRHYEVQLKQVKKSKCQSILFVDKTNTYAVSHLADILSRSGQGVPSHVAEKEEIEKAKEERKKTKPLCHSLKCFGVCRDQIKCSSRHMVFPEVDTPGSQKEYIDLPTQGTVMVLITHVVDASCYYARLIKHRPSDHHHTVSMETDAVQLNLDLQAWYADPAHQLAQRPLKIGQVCGVVDSVGCYARVQVLSWVAKATEDSPATAEVQYVDDGHYQEVSVDKLLRLPDNLLAVKFQAVEVVVCKAKPTDKDFSWTTHADLQMYQLLQGKLLEGNIALSLGNTLWLDPLVERKYLKETKALMTIYNVRQELIRRKFAVNNPEHIQNLRQLCEGKVKLPPLKSSTQEKESVRLPPPAQLRKDTANLVHLSAVDSPHCFYVQLVKSKYRLERLMETLNQKMANHTQTEDTTVAVGDFCLAQFPLDGR
ncbi:putative ATP-dependent RNA helicase TDRD12 [Diadema antillarum]|uniref:putative ATP-dependent RNA helicase TDRD12 n=1 Tax=Diadema antillarum TaxID=105358 RepID=UPI003A849C7B